jgi:predicted aldo/keto reductase-like oxidoreductase
MDERYTRREFLKIVGAAGVAALLAPGAVRAAMALAQEAAGAAEMPKRPLGKLGRDVSILGYACSALGNDDDAAVAMLNRAIDLGVNYIDTAPSYNATRCEKQVGLVMAKRRSEVWLTTKTLQRTKEGAAKDIDESLKRLRTDHLDALLLHAVETDNDVRRVLGKTGAIGALEEAKRAGKIGAIGVSSHRQPDVAAHLLDEYPFEMILIPLAVADRFYLDFADKVITKAREKGIALVGMSCYEGPLGGSPDKLANPADMLRYAYGLGVATLAVGMRTRAEVEENCRIAAGLTPLSDTERDKLLQDMRRLANPEPRWWKH